jgi:oligosaccharide repeat unit polymerase
VHGALAGRVRARGSALYRRILSPLVAFPIVWTIGVLLAQIRLLDVQRPWSRLVWVVVILVPVAFVCGGIVGRALARAWTRRGERVAVTAAARRRLRIVLAALVALGWLEELHQWAAAGAVPLLSSNVDQARFAQPGGPTIVLTDFLTVAAIVALVVPRRLLARDALPELAVAAAALVPFALAADRGSLILPVAAALVARSVYWGLPSFRVVLVVALAVATVAAAGFYYRTSQHRDHPFEHEIYAEVLPDVPVLVRPVIPIEIGVAMNFEALARIVDFFPAVVPYAHGRYDLLGLDLFFPQARDLQPLTSYLSPPWVTSTVAGPLWADGGPIGVIVGLALIGALSTAAYVAARRTSQLRWALVAGHLTYLVVFGFYTNLWTQQVDWLLIAPTLFVCGSIAEGRRIVSLPRSGDTARAWSALGGATRTVAVAGGSLVALVVASAAFEVVRSPETPAWARAPVLPVARSVVLPPIPRGATVVQPADETASTQLAYARREGRRLALTLLALEPRPARVVRRTSVAAPFAAGRASYHLTSWGGKPTLVATRARGDSIDVVLSPLDDAARAPRRIRVGAPRRCRAWRTVLLGRWSGGLPDLFVVDGGPRCAPRVRVLSGESRFGRTVFRSKLTPALTGIRNVGVHADSSGRSELLFFLRDGRTTGTERPEVHILTPESRYRAFKLQVGLGLRQVLPARVVLLGGHLRRRPVVFALDRRRDGSPRAKAIVLGPPSFPDRARRPRAARATQPS